MKPLVLLNFKVYKESMGNKALPLAKEIAAIRQDKYEIAIAPSLLTLREIAEQTSLTVFSQHTDPVQLGAQTGSITVDELKDIGVVGTILNHSERKIPFSTLKETVEVCKRKKIRTVVCASDLSEIKKVAVLRPDYLAYEPPELIGGDISVTTARPSIIADAVELVASISPATKVLCGAGVQNKEDLGQALVLGAKGVLIGHAVPKAKNPRKFLAEMLI